MPQKIIDQFLNLRSDIFISRLSTNFLKLKIDELVAANFRIGNIEMMILTRMFSV